VTAPSLVRRSAQGPSRRSQDQPLGNCSNIQRIAPCAGDAPNAPPCRLRRGGIAPFLVEIADGQACFRCWCRAGIGGRRRASRSGGQRTRVTSPGTRAHPDAGAFRGRSLREDPRSRRGALHMVIQGRSTASTRIHTDHSRTLRGIVLDCALAVVRPRPAGPASPLLPLFQQREERTGRTLRTLPDSAGPLTAWSQEEPPALRQRVRVKDGCQRGRDSLAGHWESRMRMERSARLVEQYPFG
jgi:hypothetical protein